MDAGGNGSTLKVRVLGRSLGAAPTQEPQALPHGLTAAHRPPPRLQGLSPAGSPALAPCRAPPGSGQGPQPVSSWPGAECGPGSRVAGPGLCLRQGESPTIRHSCAPEGRLLQLSVAPGSLEEGGAWPPCPAGRLPRWMTNVF